MLTPAEREPQPQPKRIQRQRTKGWRMPEGAVYVGRPSKWGNPYRVGDLINNGPPLTAKQAVARFRRLMLSILERPIEREFMRERLRGKDLACWCPLDQPCHADVLLELANSGVEVTAAEREAIRSVFCACGAQWHGKYADSQNIMDHRRRSAGDAPNRCECRIVSHIEFKARHRCKCAECKRTDPKYQKRADLIAEVARIQGLIDRIREVMFDTSLSKQERWEWLYGAIPPSPQEPDK